MKKTSCSLWIFIVFLVVSTGLALFSFDGYSILKNTTSHLGAQGSPHAWVMNAVFITLGARAIWVTFRGGAPYDQIVGGLFGISLMGTGFFQHAPLVGNVPADQVQDQVHSFFASATGFSFTFLAAGHGLQSRGPQRTAAVTMAIVAVALTLGMLLFPFIMGLLQRLMFVSAFGWLFFYRKPPSVS